MIRLNDNVYENEIYEPDEPFEFPGFNGRILNVGQIREFWQCRYCANATSIKPVKCKRCNSYSFVYMRIVPRLEQSNGPDNSSIVNRIGGYSGY